MLLQTKRRIKRPYYECFCFILSIPYFNNVCLNSNICSNIYNECSKYLPVISHRKTFIARHYQMFVETKTKSK